MSHAYTHDAMHVYMWALILYQVEDININGFYHRTIPGECVRCVSVLNQLIIVDLVEVRTFPMHNLSIIGTL